MDRYEQAGLTHKYTYKGHKIYKNTNGQFIVIRQWGTNSDECLNHFRQLKLAKGFIDRMFTI